jgi:hypothetical protein
LKGEDDPKNTDEHLNQKMNPERSQNPIWRKLNLEPASQHEQHLQSCESQRPWKNASEISLAAIHNEVLDPKFWKSLHLPVPNDSRDERTL